MRRLISGLVVVLLVLVPGAALGDDTTITDRNDENGFLDIKSASAKHGKDGRVKHAITTFEGWKSRKLADCATLAFVFPDSDRYLRIYFKKGSLRARLSRTGGGGTSARPAVWRPARNKVTVSFYPSRLASGSRYKWRAVTGSPSGGCSEGSGDIAAFFDRAPNKRNVIHDL